MGTAVSIRGLSKRFKDVIALDGVNLDIEKGAVFGLVGPNGAGKTTLIRALVGALQPDSGTIDVAGTDPTASRQEARLRIGYMPQTSVLYADLTARENVAFFYRGHVKGDPDDAVDVALEFADLGEFADRPLHTLSGGVQQRVSLAVAMAHQPEMLLLDEPTAGVDPELRGVFWRGFRRLTESGTTILVTTHQMDEVVHCDRVALLRNGRILAEATPSDLLASGGAVVRVWRRGEPSEELVEAADVDLPRLLRGDGLDAGVDRIEVIPATLEEVILGLVNDDAADHAG